jgi:hypothetical protein
MNPSPDDFTLLNELWQMIEHDPTSTYPRKLLIEQLMHYGWIDAAVDASEELLKISPYDQEAKDFVLNNKREVVKPSPVTKQRSQTKKVLVPNSSEERKMLEEQFAEELLALRQEVEDLAHSMQDAASYAKTQGLSTVTQGEIDYVTGLQNGELQGIVQASVKSARDTAQAMKDQTDYFKVLDIAVQDLEATLDRLKQTTKSNNDDSLRELLAKRVRILVSSVSTEQQAFPPLALMHIEHEKLNKKYVNDETMLGDTIAEIPRYEFWVSEDGYAWSMEELVSAVKANGGVMRNPLSKDMFSPEDIKMVLFHPDGKALGALQLEQSQLSHGVRLATIQHLESLAKVLLADDADDQFESRKAIGRYRISRVVY